MDSYEVINYIASAKKRTPVKAYISGELQELQIPQGAEVICSDNLGIFFGEYTEFQELLKNNGSHIQKYRIEIDRRNSAVPLADLSKYNARIEPGAIIRDLVEIGDNCVIMMGAVINIGAVIGERTMIDMNTVIGGRAVIGKNCHIGAGTVIAGVIEPPNAQPVEIGDNVVMGANAVVLEGVKIGSGAVVAAGSVVISDVPENAVIAGVPGRIIKMVDDRTKSKTLLVESLRNL